MTSDKHKKLMKIRIKQTGKIPHILYTELPIEVLEKPEKSTRRYKNANDNKS